MYQQILIMSTRGGDLRSEAVGWTAENSAQVLRYAGSEHYNRHACIGRIPAWDRKDGEYTHEAPLYAMAAGWKLMAPPKQDKDGDYWEWWFTRD